MSLYTINGALNAPQGILLHAQRPMSLEVIGAAGANLLFTTSPTGHRNIISQSGDTEAAVTILDSAGYYGQSTDGVYWISGYVFTPAVIGTRGDGVTPGGWTIVCHFIPIQNNISSTTTAIGADLDESGSVVCSGARQKLAEQNDACAFFLDLQNATGATFQPSVTIADSSSTAAEPRYNDTDSSGETPRFWTVWEGISDFGLSPGYGQPALPAPYAGPYTSATTIGTTGSGDVDVNGADGIAGPVNFLSNPPMFRASKQAGTSINNNVTSIVTLGSTADVDNYSGWNSSTTYTIQRDGLYLTHGIVPYSADTTGTRRCGIQVNGGTVYWGPGYNAPPGGETIASKTQIFSFQAGDTVVLVTEQNSGGALALASGDESRMFLAWLGLEGTPSTLWTPPDTSFRWQAGTAGTDLPGLFQAHLANDLGFLCNRPYLMAYQTVAQSGFSNNTWNTVTLDTVAGIIHADTGDNYSGWTSGSSNNYAAVAAGWYLVVGEFFSTYPSTTTSPSLRAGISTVTSGGRTPSASPDRYQELFPSTSAYPPAATVCALYYLSAGESVTPQIYGQSYTAGTWGTQETTGINSHLEVIWLSN